MRRNVWLLIAYLASVLLLLSVLGALALPGLVRSAGRVSTAPRISPRPGATLPPSFPANIPTYPGATLVDAQQQQSGQLLAIWETDDDPDRVYGFYKTRLNEGQWRVVQAVNIGPYTTVQFAPRGDPLSTGQVVVQRRQGGGSLILLQILPSPLRRR